MAAAEVLREIPDVELIDDVLKGDQASFEILYERYFPRVYAYVNKRVSNRADTEEITQEVFINVFSALDSFRGEAPFVAWTLGIARRTVANRFKKKRHPTVPLEGEAELENLDPFRAPISRAATPLEVYECQERIGLLKETATHELSEEQRLLYEMHHLRHLSIQQIARDLNKTEDSIKSNLYRARKLLLAE